MKTTIRALFQNTDSNSGEVNTGTNVGDAGVGVFKQKNEALLEFKKIKGGIGTKINTTDPDVIEINKIPTPVAINSATSLEIDFSISEVMDLTLGHNATINLIGGLDGQALLLRLRVSSFTPTWGTMLRFSSDVAEPTFTENTLNYLAFRYNATDAKYDCMAVNKGF